MEVNVPKNADPPFDFSPLHVTDPFLTNHEEFFYGLDAVDGAVLEPKGFKSSNADGIIMHIREDCHSALNNKRVPRLSLANHLYRGKLPIEFQDLTWVEEMVCAKY